METIISEWISQNHTLITTVISFIATLATLFYAILTYKLLSETIKLRKVETEPDVIIYLEPFHANFLNMIIKNIGNGPAYDIQFTYDKEHPLANLEMPNGTSIKNVQLFNGLSYMAPGHEIKFYFASALQIPNVNDISPLTVSIQFRSSKNKKKEVYTRVYRIAISDFLGLRWIGGDPVDDIRKALVSIMDHIGHVTTGSENVHVNIDNQVILQDKKEDTVSEGVEVQDIE